MDTFSFPDMQQPIMAPSLPHWMTPASAPPSPDAFDIPLRPYPAHPSLMSSPYTQPHPLFTPHFQRPSSLPDASTLRSEVPPFSTPISYPSMSPTFPNRRALHARHRDMRPYRSHSLLEPSYLNIPMPFAPRSRSLAVPPGRLREKIPQGLMASQDRACKIDFAVHGAPGVRLVDAFNKFAELDDGEAQPFTNNGSRQIRLVIQVRAATRSPHAKLIELMVF